MVPGSTLRYGSHFWRVTLRPRLSSRQPIEAAATPFPREETTPPVTKMYFGPVRKAPEFPPVESAYYLLWSEPSRVSNPRSESQCFAARAWFTPSAATHRRIANGGCDNSFTAWRSLQSP